MQKRQRQDLATLQLPQVDLGIPELKIPAPERQDPQLGRGRGVLVAIDRSGDSAQSTGSRDTAARSRVRQSRCRRASTCVFYVLTWEIIYFNFTPDFMDKYAVFLAQKAHELDMSAAALRAQLEQIQKMKVLHNNVFYNAAITFLEPFPVGLAITLLSAVILRKRAQPQPASSPLPVPE